MENLVIQIYISISVIIWLGFIMRHMYFSFKYEEYVKKYAPAKLRQLVLFPFKLDCVDQFMTFYNLFKNYETEDVNLIRLKTKARRACIGVLLTMLFSCLGFGLLANLFKLYRFAQ